VVSDFKFISIGQDSSLLTAGINRYTAILSSTPPSTFSLNCSGTGSPLQVLSINITGTSLILDDSTDESYKLIINSPQALIQASTVFGGLHGLETFSQLLVRYKNELILSSSKITISDSPRFPHRGLMIDTGRHYLPMSSLLATLDAMAYHKFNVLHWHMVDDEAFPYNSTVLPLLYKGAFSPKHTYNHTELKSLVQYALERGIRIIPEFDTPGHSTSWGDGYPNLLTSCPSKSWQSRPMDPTIDSTYSLLETLFSEVATIFPDRQIHLGGDEVSPVCWNDNPKVKAWMKDHNMTTFEQLQSYFEEKLFSIIIKDNRDPIVWEEVFTNRGNWPMPPTSIIEVWISPAGDYTKLVEVVKAGFRAIYTTVSLYLDYQSPGDRHLSADWQVYYSIDPIGATKLTPAEKKLVLGGEVCMWAPYQDATNFMSVVFPRASAVAGVLWSENHNTNMTEVSDNLHAFRCLLLARGIGSAPVLFGSYCPEPWNFVYLPPWQTIN
jgi:hexosaminidase